MSKRRRHILVTGGSGYIGSRLVNIAIEQGFQITLLGRSPASIQSCPGIRFFTWQLNTVPPDEAFQAGPEFTAVDAVIHLAHSWRGDSSIEDDRNVMGTEILLSSARRNGVRRFVFASSVSSRPDALNRYGRVKWAIEQKLKPADELVARIGLVYGGPLTGQWNILCGLVKSAPILPMVGADTEIQPIHLDEACDGLLKIARISQPQRSVYGLCAHDTVSFGTFLRLLAKAFYGRKITLFPVPFRLALALASITRAIPFLPSIDRERLLGIAGIPTLKTADDLSELNLVLRPLTEGLKPPIYEIRRRLLDEAYVLTRYLIGGKPSAQTLKLYVNGLILHGNGSPIRLPALAIKWPPLMRIFEPRNRSESENGKSDTLRSRIHLALMVVESTTEGAPRLYDYQGKGWLPAFAILGLVAVIEIALFPLRLIFGSHFKP